MVLLEYYPQFNKHKLSSTHISHTVQIHLSILCRVGNIRCNHQQNQTSYMVHIIQIKGLLPIECN